MHQRQSYPTVNCTHGVTVDLEVLSAILLYELGHVHKRCHVIPCIGHLNIAEALCRYGCQFALAFVSQLAPPCRAHPPKVNQILHLAFRQLCTLLQNMPLTSATKGQAMHTGTDSKARFIQYSRLQTGRGCHTQRSAWCRGSKDFYVMAVSSAIESQCNNVFMYTTSTQGV